ncbi:MAG TPA: ATP-binding domain-containing protein [Kofleriaceae bacterium]|nr:ATP-binding domain-containing protein [Kofleriaceae bacterium]
MTAAAFDAIEAMLVAAPSAQGVLRVTTARGERTYLLGPRTQLEGESQMLDWRTAPIGEAFFRYAPGEAYEIEAGERTTEGRVAARWLVVGRGKLDALLGEDRVVTRDGERALPRPAPVPVAQADRSALPVLDPEQQAAVDLPADTSLVIDGEAGVGKTLVALYRVASLQRRADERSRRFRALVLVPTEGLRRLVRLLADRLGIGKLEIAVLDDWLVERAHAAFPGLPKRTSEGATAQVIGLKRHPAVRVVLDDFVGWKPPRGVDDDKLPRSRMRLLHLFGDRDRLQRVVDASGGVLPARAITAVQHHTRMQFETTTERAHRHVDADRLVALDGRRLDAGTPMEDAHTFDAEDVPVLFELVRRGALPVQGSLAEYDHIVVDEVQLRAPMELAAIGDALAKHGTVTLAGDHRQATDESAWFAGWAAARAELRRARWSEVTLAVTYRSVPAISEFARALVERRAVPPPEPPPDPAVWFTAAPHALAQTALLCWHLTALLAREPWRQICVIARTKEHAQRLHGELSRGLDPTLVLDGDFRFEPGVIVTTAAAVSGLEFDCVVIPDYTPEFWPPTPELTRSLYVAATRARDWLWLTTPSP